MPSFCEQWRASSDKRCRLTASTAYLSDTRAPSLHGDIALCRNPGPRLGEGSLELCRTLIFVWPACNPTFCTSISTADNSFLVCIHSLYEEVCGSKCTVLCPSKASLLACPACQEEVWQSPEHGARFRVEESLDPGVSFQIFVLIAMRRRLIELHVPDARTMLGSTVTACRRVEYTPVLKKRPAVST